jgi:hypothetical protein
MKMCDPFIILNIVAVACDTELALQPNKDRVCPTWLLTASNIALGLSILALYSSLKKKDNTPNNDREQTDEGHTIEAPPSTPAAA